MTDELRRAFDDVEPLTVGLEEEVVLLDHDTLDLLPIASDVVDGGDPRIKLELPATQVELISAPHRSVPGAIAEIAEIRRALVALAGDRARPAALAVHPFAAAEGTLNGGERYAALAAEYGPVSRRQLVCALQVHVAVGDADTTLAVYNELRGHLPEIAALAAAAPFHAGRDTNLASIRPQLAELLPRQGMPPIIESWDALGEELRWGAVSGFVSEPGNWWWELRPHVVHGTLEIRVPDVQPALADGAAIAAVGHAVVAWLSARARAGDLRPPVSTWRIEQNRWSALRHGVEGNMAELRSGRLRTTRECLADLLDAIEPFALDLGCADQITHARRLVEANGAIRLRRAGDPHAATAWAAQQFLAHED